MSDVGARWKLALDFDGVIHDHGNKPGFLLEGSMVPGFVEWALEANKKFCLFVYSTRSATPEGIAGMKDWMRRSVAERMEAHEIEAFVAMFQFAAEKPWVHLIIDDRAIQFRGDWKAWWLEPARLRGFKPWTAAPTPSCAEADAMERRRTLLAEALHALRTGITPLDLVRRLEAETQ